MSMDEKEGLVRYPEGAKHIGNSHLYVPKAQQDAKVKEVVDQLRVARQLIWDLQLDYHFQPNDGLLRKIDEVLNQYPEEKRGE